MSTARKAPKPRKTSSDKLPASFQIDIVFSGPLLFVPELQDGNVIGLEVYSPCNEHPVGATFLPGTFFTAEELDDPESENWPEPRNFSLLDSHSYLLRLTQNKRQVSFPVASIPESNHKVRAGRRLSGDWHVALRVIGQLSSWSTHRLHPVSEGMYYGSDRPTGPTVATLQRLSYADVTGMETHGLGSEQTEYLRTNLQSGGTLIIEGEAPYQSTLLHERNAIDALAKLAGLNLHLMISAPIAGRTRLQGKVYDCLNSVIAI